MDKEQERILLDYFKTLNIQKCSYANYYTYNNNLTISFQKEYTGRTKSQVRNNDDPTLYQENKNQKKFYLPIENFQFGFDRVSISYSKNASSPYHYEETIDEMDFGDSKKSISEISKNPISVVLMLAKLTSNIEYYQNNLQLLYDSDNLKQNKFQMLTYFELDFSLIEIYKYSGTAIEENYLANTFLIFHSEFHYIRYNGILVFDIYLESLLPKRIKTEKVTNRDEFPENMENTETFFYDKDALFSFLEKYDFSSYRSYLKKSRDIITPAWF